MLLVLWDILCTMYISLGFHSFCLNTGIKIHKGIKTESSNA